MQLWPTKLKWVSLHKVLYLTKGANSRDEVTEWYRERTLSQDDIKENRFLFDGYHVLIEQAYLEVKLYCTTRIELEEKSLILK